jgi:hypothetical protein
MPLVVVFTRKNPLNVSPPSGGAVDQKQYHSPIHRWKVRGVDFSCWIVWEFDYYRVVSPCLVSATLSEPYAVTLKRSQMAVSHFSPTYQGRRREWRGSCQIEHLS